MIEKLISLSKKCWNDYEEFSRINGVKQALKTQEMREAMPILFFGDHKRYVNSKVKIITVGINPSRIEFPAQDPFRRFPDMKGIIKNKSNSDSFHNTYLHSLSNYFQSDPYLLWFNHYEQVLRGINASYFEEGLSENISLHTDLYSVFPTDPVWTTLEKEPKQQLAEHGIKMWRNLVDILQPDVILMSTSEEMTTKLGLQFTSGWNTIHSFHYKANGEDRRRPYEVKKRTLKLSNGKEVQLFFGAAGVTPFQLITNEQKRETGRTIMSSFKQECNKSFVQFMHPGAEHDGRKADGEIFPWNVGEHKRKFMVNNGKYVNDLADKEVKKVSLTFWGEWEAEAKIVQRLDGINGPRYLMQPFYEKPNNYIGRQNTDPFIFGDHFYYTCCRQYKKTRNDRLVPTLLTRLQFGSVILFGSNFEGGFVLDTVFVVSDDVRKHNKHNIDDIAEELSETYADVTLAPLYPEYYSEADVPAMNPSSTCLEDFETEEVTEDGTADDPSNLLFSLYKGINYYERGSANGMFSFFPSKPYDEQSIGFKRPTIQIDNFINDNLNMGFKNSYVSEQKVKELWMDVVNQVVEQGFVLGIQTELPEQIKEFGKVGSSLPEEESMIGSREEVPASRDDINGFVRAYRTLNINREDITNHYLHHKFYSNHKEFWFAPLAFKNVIPPLDPVYINKVHPWKSCYAFSYFFYKVPNGKLALKLELGPYKPENGSRNKLLKFLHEVDNATDRRFNITKGALVNKEAKTTRLVKAECEINDWNDEKEILNKMEQLLMAVEFDSLTKYAIDLFEKYNTSFHSMIGTQQ
ncbi:hypothetical protein [Peribacillus deserti]|uniref:Uncharacterized protein n=1 Tax=Peribacillus deserti TaxID=673318 RepID=A0A2N5M9J7_9BACI|nr:hypothetical protein [Peribacillus deserti]PLT31022.1 hypothetical protein CUU66_04240 [Peribacillus deserti]